MEYVKKDLGSYNLHVIKTNKFKTIMVRVVFQRPIKKEEITIRNVLSDMFLQSSKKYKSKRELSIKAQDLYAADITTGNSRLGNYMVTNFYLSLLNDKYTEEGNFEAGLEFLSEIIFNPDVKNNKFNSKQLDVVKSNCRSALNSIKEDASNYSVIRLFEELDNSTSSYRMNGYLEDLDNIDVDSLYTYYESMIKSDLVDIFVIGDVDEEDMVSLFRKYFKIKTLKKRKTNYLLDDVSCRKKKKVSYEDSDNNQSNLAIACRVHGLSDYERNYPLTLFNIIFGGGCDSKLFKEVREEHSLCYSVYSVPNKLDHLLIIKAGIDRYNFDKTIEIIEKELNDMKKGKFNESDINTAKEYYETAIEATEESQHRLIDNYMMMEFIGTDTLDVKREMMSKVTKKEIVKVAKKINIDTIFLLEGGK